MRRAARGPRGSAGFTLLEVLVALAVLSLAVVAAIQGFAQGLRLLKLSGDHQQAMLIADLKAREVVTPEEGREEGAEGDFRWERTTRVVEAPDLTPVGAPPKWRVFEIAVKVRWDERRQVDLTTLRTVPVRQLATAPASDAQQPPTSQGPTPLFRTPSSGPRSTTSPPGRSVLSPRTSP